jgi:hypothetical protein
MPNYTLSTVEGGSATQLRAITVPNTHGTAGKVGDPIYVDPISGNFLDYDRNLKPTYLIDKAHTSFEWGGQTYRGHATIPRGNKLYGFNMLFTTSNTTNQIRFAQYVMHEDKTMEYVDLVTRTAGVTTSPTNFQLNSPFKIDDDTWVAVLSSSTSVRLDLVWFTWDEGNQRFTATITIGTIHDILTNTNKMNASFLKAHDGTVFLVGQSSANNPQFVRLDTGTQGFVSVSTPLQGTAETPLLDYAQATSNVTRMQTSDGKLLVPLSDRLNYELLGWDGTVWATEALTITHSTAATAATSGRLIVPLGTDKWVSFYVNVTTGVSECVFLTYDPATTELTTAYYRETGVLTTDITFNSSSRAFALGNNEFIFQSASNFGDFVHVTFEEGTYVTADRFKVYIGNSQNQGTMGFHHQYDEANKEVIFTTKGIGEPAQTQAAVVGIFRFQIGKLLENRAPILVGYLAEDAGANYKINVTEPVYNTSSAVVGQRYNKYDVGIDSTMILKHKGNISARDKCISRIDSRLGTNTLVQQGISSVNLVVTNDRIVVVESEAALGKTDKWFVGATGTNSTSNSFFGGLVQIDGLPYGHFETEASLQSGQSAFTWEIFGTEVFNFQATIHRDAINTHVYIKQGDSLNV